MTRERPAAGFGVNGKRSGRAGLSAEGEHRSHERSAPGRTLELEPATQGFDPVGESTESRAAGGARATASVVADSDDDLFVRIRNLDPRLGRVSVFGGVGQALGDEVVDGCFDAFAEAVRGDADDRDREGG